MARVAGFGDIPTAGMWDWTVTGGSFAQPSGFYMFFCFILYWLYCFYVVLRCGQMSQSFGSNRCDFPCKIVYPLRIDESMLKPGAARMRGSNGMDEETAFVSKFSKNRNLWWKIAEFAECSWQIHDWKHELLNVACFAPLLFREPRTPWVNFGQAFTSLSALYEVLLNVTVQELSPKA